MREWPCFLDIALNMSGVLRSYGLSEVLFTTMNTLPTEASGIG